jgi:hypothetical protein
MELDFSRTWHVLAPSQAAPDGPAAFAAAELAAVIGRCPRCARPEAGDESATERIIILDAGRGGKAASRFSWRAAADRVEIYGTDEATLLRAVYDFLGALGARWPEPGNEAERLPTGPLLALEVEARTSSADALPCTLILGHGCFLEDWEQRLVWAARMGYRSVFVHTTPDDLALGAAPWRLYETLRPGIAAAASRLGLGLELGGHFLSSFLPRSLFKSESELFREANDKRVADCNFCPSSEKAMSIVAGAFAAWAGAHPEIGVFHAWPDDLGGGGWCSCPTCARLSPAAQSLSVARALASALSATRPDTTVSFLAYHDTEDVAREIEGGLPPNLELLWAPRRRSWGRALCDGDSRLNAASIARFEKNARAWRAAGGGRVSVFEYYEDALLFKAAVPPLGAVIEGDLAAYRAAGAEAVGILCTGGRLPLAPRPNVAMLPSLAALPLAALGRGRASEILANWAAAAYGKAKGPMLEYWRELEAAWAIDLDIEDGETALYTPSSPRLYASEAIADWGDPWKTSLERLAARRDRCEELFDHLRRAEARLAEATAMDQTARREEMEYAISDAVLELDCARLSVYHELAGGDARAAADLANLALSASGAARKAFSRLPDARARREMRLLIGVFYDLRLRTIRRANARSGVRHLFDLWYTSLKLYISTLRVRRAYEPRGGVSSASGLAVGIERH